MKKHSVFFLCLIFMFLKALAPTESHPNITPTYANTGDILRSFLKPVQFSRDGINHFFTTTFNSTLYADFLGSCFIHIDDFIAHGLAHDKPCSYYESVFMLFHHRLKESAWVNPYALLLFLDQITLRMQDITDNHQQETAQLIETELKKIIAALPTQKINNSWYTSTAEQLLATLDAQGNNSSLHELKKSFVLLIESAYGKLIWNPHDNKEIWNIIKLLCKKCENLYQAGHIENLDDLNRLIWSILYRFGYFIDITGTQLPNTFYQHIREDIAKEVPTYLKFEEQEIWLTKKIDYLNNILMRAEIKNSITQQGMLSDAVKKVTAIN